jgi:hypothetical protein
VNIDTMPAGGYVFRLGDTGMIEGAAENIYYLATGLRDYAIEHFPDSEFAKEHRRGFE